MRISFNLRLNLIFVLLLSGVLTYNISKAQHDTEPGTIVDAGGFNMIYVPGATYEIGIDQDRLAAVCQERVQPDIAECVQFEEENGGATYTYTVNIPAFWIDQYEVTIKQFQTACARSYIWFRQGCDDRNLPPEFEETPEQPQVDVTWLEATEFCGARHARLPTEDEWEYAASGPEKLIYPWSNDFNENYVHAPDTPFPPGKTYRVGTIPENRSWIGVYDMAGNAAEWVEDRFLPRFLKGIYPDTLPVPAYYKRETARVVRGGGWDGRPWAMMTFSREQADPEIMDALNGFRCARSLDPIAQP